MLNTIALWIIALAQVGRLVNRWTMRRSQQRTAKTTGPWTS